MDSLARRRLTVGNGIETEGGISVRDVSVCVEQCVRRIGWRTDVFGLNGLFAYVKDANRGVDVGGGAYTGLTTLPRVVLKYECPWPLRMLLGDKEVNM